MNKKLCLIFALMTHLISARAETIKFSADSMSGTAGSKSSVTILKGNAKVTTQNMQISADSIEISGDNFRLIKAEGSVEGRNTETNMDFSCGNMLYDRNTKIARLENSVKLTDIENGLTAQAQIIEYSETAETAVMQIQVNITQKDNVCTCAHAIYKKREQLLDMSGNPSVVQKGDTFRAQNITLNLQSQEIQLSGRVKGSVSSSQPENQAGEE